MTLLGWDSPSHDWLSGLRPGFAVGSLLLVVSCAGEPTSDVASSNPEPEWDKDLVTLLASSISRDSVTTEFGIDPISSTDAAGALVRLLGRDVRPDDSLWPLYRFIIGEERLTSGDSLGARSDFWELARWASSDPYSDRWGGNTLAVIALWRVVSLYEAAGTVDSAVADSILTVADGLLGTRLVDGLFRMPLLATLPRLEESLLRSLPRLASASRGVEEAIDRFIRYQNIATVGQMDDFERQLLNGAISRALVTQDRLDFIRGRKLIELRDYEAGLSLLRRAWQGDDLQVRALAGLALSSVLQTYPGDTRAFREAGAILDTLVQYGSEPDLAERALYARSFLARSLGDTVAFVSSLENLVSEYPTGNWGDDALFRLGEYDRIPHPNRALEFLTRLRAWSGENDWLESASYSQAMILYGRGGQQDLVRAAAILDSFLVRFPESTLRPHATFWAGRIQESIGQTEAANEYFERVKVLSPYSYYGIRARLHLSQGPAAATRIPADARSAEALRTAHQTTSPDSFPELETPYHLLLTRAIQSGLYASALPLPRVRFEEWPVERLASSGSLARIAVLLTLRQIAIAAVEANQTATNRIQVARQVGQGAGDWSLATYLMMLDHVPTAVRQGLQEQEGFLDVAYPSTVFHDEFVRAGERHDVSASLLYSVVREETAFASTALSPSGALGLFQFMPLTLDSLSTRWGIPELKEDSYLMDPARNIEMGARWFADELLPEYRMYPNASHRVALAIMEHHAGRPAVRKFRKDWRALGEPDDLEYLVEIAPSSATRNMLRRVLASLTIIEALEVFDE